ncbi:MAG TPA: hypothetical protein PLI34_14050 [Saprospiraceae bacterium]|nr:hypothetical protein [Saprospiraceae bacterium]HRJ16115.1 hypothetical protein [Saprospiraceae bacterium]
MFMPPIFCAKNDDKKTKNPAGSKLSESNKSTDENIIVKPQQAAGEKLRPEKFIIVNPT